MHMVNKIIPDYEPRRKILSHIPNVPGEPEMSEFESAFLCGLLKKFRPKKILEIGVAAGGTTAVMLQCLEDMKLDSDGGGRRHMSIRCIQSSCLRSTTEVPMSLRALWLRLPNNI